MRIERAAATLIKGETKTKHIERIARICYKSEDKICEGSDRKMIENLLIRKHMAMLEHADAVFEIPPDLYTVMRRAIAFWTGEMDLHPGHQRSYLRLTRTQLKEKTRYLMSGNFRAWYEFIEYLHTDFLAHHNIPKAIEKVLPYINDSMSGILSPMLSYIEGPYVRTSYEEARLIREITDMDMLTGEERMVHERFSVLFTADRGVTHELVRMRESSFAQESTRYVNYQKAKFGREIAVIDPLFFEPDAPKNENSRNPYIIWKEACKAAERYYMELTDMGVPAQQARSVLPHSTKVDIVMTANLEEWRHIFELRACDKTGPAHPQMKEIMVPLLDIVKPLYSFAFGDLKPAKIL